MSMKFGLRSLSCLAGKPMTARIFAKPARRWVGVLSAWLLCTIAASCQPNPPSRGEDLRTQLRLKNYDDILSLGKTLREEARADLAPLSADRNLTVPQKKALRMVLASLGDDEAQKLTLAALCSSAMDQRREVFRELHYIDGKPALQAVRSLLNFLDVLPWQETEGDMLDMPFAFQSLQLLAALRPESPAGRVPWLFASVPKRLPEYTRPSIEWLEQTEKVSRLPAKNVPQCLQRLLIPGGGLTH